MKKNLLTILLVFSLLPSMAAVKWNQRYQSYIDQYKDLAIYEMLQYRIPASITLAQGLLESSAGDSDLSRKGNNHFGIKCHDWTGPTMHHDDDLQGECFRVYDDAFGSYEDHSKFLHRKRYQSLFSLSPYDYAAWARGLKKAGYATNPRYANLLIDIIETYRLYEYDKAKTYDVARIHKPKPQTSVAVTQPTTRRTSTRSNQDDEYGPHKVYKNNDLEYIIARNSDTFNILAQETGISARKLAKYNELDRDEILRKGDVIYLHKKRTHANKAYRNYSHVVKPNESMYTISQTYGIRLKSLYKLNNLTPDYKIHVGDRIRVY